MKKVFDINEAVTLYEEGYSQKDIASKYKISIPELRRLLNEKGFDTKTYRNVPEHIRKLIAELIRHGFSYREISKILDISYHVIREIAKEYDFVGGSKLFSRINIKEPVFSSGSLDAFINEYKTGHMGFVKLIDKHFKKDVLFPMEIALYLCQYVLEKDIVKTHQENFFNYVHEQLSSGTKANVIAKQMGVSFSLVKRCLLNQEN